MAKIRNSSTDNWYGGGKQQIFTDDDGKEYVIKNSSLDNFYGDGKQKIVSETGADCNIPVWLAATLVIIAVIIQLIIKYN